MPFNGSGVWSASSYPGSWNPAVTGSTANPTDWNSLLADLSLGLTTAICRDGQTTITANLPMAGFRHTGVGNASATNHYGVVGQIQNGAYIAIDDSGAADAYVLTLSPAAIAAYAAYQRFQFIAAHTNTTTSTVAVSGLAAKTIKQPDGSALAAGAIVAGGLCDIQYNGTDFILLSGGAGSIPTSLLTTRGQLIRRGATAAQALTLGSTGLSLVSNGVDAVWDVPTLTKYTNSLSGDVLLSNTSTYFTGPAVAQGGSGIWFVSGSVTMLDGGGAANYSVKLWDGTTVIDSAVTSSASAQFATAALSGYIASPAGNLCIAVKDTSSTGGAILFNTSGNSKDSTITAIRIG